MNTEQLKAVLDAHAQWLAGDGGERANLREANLRGADLGWVDLREANLSYSKGLLDPVEWLEKNCTRTSDGILAYKCFGEHYAPPDSWRIESGAEIAEVVNPLPTINCGCGVNVATLEWCQREHPSAVIWEVLIRWEWLIGAVVPYNTDGQFRVPRAKLVREMEGRKT